MTAETSDEGVRKVGTFWPKLVETARRRRHVVILAAIVLASLALRLYVSSHCSLWLDEALTLNHAQKPWFRGGNREHAPFYFTVVKLVLSVFGFTDTSLRATSLAFGCVLLVAVYELALTLGFKVERALLVVASLAVTPFFMRHATEARQYAMYPAFATLALTRALRVVREPRDWRSFAGFALAVVLMPATQYFGLAYAGALLGVVAVATLPGWWKDPARRISLRYVVVILFVAGAFGVLALRAYALTRYYANPSLPTAVLPKGQLFAQILSDFALMDQRVWALALEPLLTVGGLTLVSRRLPGIARALPFGLGLVPCVALLFVASGHGVDPRYVAPSFIVYHLGACAGLFALVDRIPALTAGGANRIALGRVLGWAVLATPFGLRLAEYPKGFGAGEDYYRGLQRYFEDGRSKDAALVTFDGYYGRFVMGLAYQVGRPPIPLDRFQPVPGIDRYVVAEIHVAPERQGVLETLVEEKLGLSHQEWRALPLIPLSSTVFQPAVRARLVVLEPEVAQRALPPPADERRTKPTRNKKQRRQKD